MYIYAGNDDDGNIDGSRKHWGVGKMKKKKL